MALLLRSTGLVGVLLALMACPAHAERTLPKDTLRACALASGDAAATSICWQAMLRLEGQFQHLWSGTRAAKPLRKGKTQTLAPFTLLELEDRDRDGQGDFFAYYPENGSRRTQEFGAYFDLNGDRRPDWIVFYGGIFPTKQLDVYTWFHHAIDTNGDGRFDLRIYEAIDLDGDKMPEREASAWVFDTDHDGKVDLAQHVVSARGSGISPRADGLLALGYILEGNENRLPHVGQPMPAQLFDLVAVDIAALEQRGGK